MSRSDPAPPRSTERHLPAPHDGTEDGDPWGLRPRFVRTGGDGIERTGARISALVDERSAVDPLGLATLLTLGIPLGTRTLVEGVSRSAPHGRPAPAPLPDTQLEELVVEATRAACARGLGASPAFAGPIVPLSGGRDSRLILLALRRLSIRPRVLLTAGARNASEDARIASELAALYGDPIEHVPELPFAERAEAWRHDRTSGESLEHGWFLGVALRAHALGGLVTDGIGAGVLATGSLMYPEAVELWRRGALDELARWTVGHSAGVGSEFIDALRADGVPLASEDEVLGELASTIAALRHYPNPLGAFSMLHWTRRGIAASAFGLLPAARVVAPLADAEVISAQMAVELDDALRSDWRDRLLARLDRSGIRHAGGAPPVRRRSVRGTFAALAYRRFLARRVGHFAGALRVHDAQQGPRRIFQRSALTLLCALGQWGVSGVPGPGRSRAS